MSEDQDVPKQPPNEETAAETSQQDSSISASETNTLDMEVHHHPNVEKKNFKEYFLEFLMIFLAVTMGFFAESLREDISEKKMMHGYMAQMVENMKFDTTRFSNALQYNKKVSLY